MECLGMKSRKTRRKCNKTVINRDEDRQIGKQTNKQIDKQTNGETDKQTNGGTAKLTNRKTIRRQIGRKSNIEQEKREYRNKQTKEIPFNIGNTRKYKICNIQK